MNKFKTVYDIKEFPRYKSEEEYKNWIQKYIEAGAIPKKDLVSGGWYLGNSRSTFVAQWWPDEGFHYIRYKMGGKFVDTINHFEDDNGCDLFIPFKLII